MLTVVLVVLAALVVVAIALGVVGRETARLADVARPAVFDLEEAVAFIADRLDEGPAGRLTHDDVRWILRTDADVLADATAELAPGDDHVAGTIEVVDEDEAVARILARADDEDRDVADEDVVAVLDARAAYLEAIGAIGPRAADPLDPDEADPGSG